VLFSATGVGTVLGGLALASGRNAAHKARLMIASAALWAVAMCAFAASRSFAPALVALLLVGVFQVGVGSTMVTLLQTRVPREMSGRVMSLNTLLIMGVRPLGDFLASALIGRFGAPPTATACAALVGVLALAVATRRSVREA
jgi:predicted MFS family arabinose efflux permease